jgi:hypothetical protein
MPIPLPEMCVNDYSPDENNQNYMSQATAAYHPPMDNSFAIAQMSAHQANGVCNEFTNVPNPLIGFSVCFDTTKILLRCCLGRMSRSSKYPGRG